MNKKYTLKDNFVALLVTIVMIVLTLIVTTGNQAKIEEGKIYLMFSDSDMTTSMTAPDYPQPHLNLD
jgi:hypothetical protein